MSLSAVIMAAARKWGTRSATRRVRPRADKAASTGLAPTPEMVTAMWRSAR